MSNGAPYNNSYEQPGRIAALHGRGGFEYQRAEAEYIPAASYHPRDGAMQRPHPSGYPYNNDRERFPYSVPPERAPVHGSVQRFEGSSRDSIQYSGDRNQQVRTERPPAKFVHSAGPPQNNRGNFQGGPRYRPPPGAASAAAVVATVSALASGRGPPVPPPSRDPRLRK